MVGSAVAQKMEQPAPPYGSAPHTAPVEKSTPYRVEGAVKEVDSGAQTVKISTGLFGIMRRTLDVNEQTFIHVDGQQVTIADIARRHAGQSGLRAARGEEHRRPYRSHAARADRPQFDTRERNRDEVTEGRRCERGLHPDLHDIVALTPSFELDPQLGGRIHPYGSP